MLLIIISALLIAPGISAQITLTQSSYPESLIGTDSLKMTTSVSSYPSLVAMVGGTWDMSIVTDSTPVFFAYRVPTVTYEFADSNVYGLLGYAYKGNVQSSVTGSAFVEYGINIQGAGYTLAPITSVITDSLFIDTQAMVYSSLRTIIAFPATDHSSWSSVYTSAFNFQLSLSDILFNYHHTPGVVKSYITEKDTVIGWGQMRVKDAGGSPSSYFNVLQVQTTITTADSFYIDDTAFSSSLLLALGLSQGKVVSTYQQNYYRPQEVTPLARVTFTDATFSQPESATTHIQRLATDAVPYVINDAGINIYPNPVIGGIVSIDLPTGSEWSYELADVTGRVIGSAALQPNGNHTQFTLPSSILPGTYYIGLYNHGKQFCVKQVDVLR
jgi:hypothetical protein